MPLQITFALILLTSACSPTPHGFDQPVEHPDHLPALGPVAAPDGALFVDTHGLERFSLDGTITTEREAPPDFLWSAADGTVIAYVRESGELLHRDPSGAWVSRSLPIPDRGGWIQVSGTSGTDLWLDLDAAEFEPTPVAHYDGTSWSALGLDADVVSLGGVPIAVRPTVEIIETVRRRHLEVAHWSDGAWQWLERSAAERLSPDLSGETGIFTRVFDGLWCGQEPGEFAVDANLVITCPNGPLIAHDLRTDERRVLDPWDVGHLHVRQVGNCWYGIGPVESSGGCFSRDCPYSLLGHEVWRFQGSAWESIAMLPPTLDPGDFVAVGAETWVRQGTAWIRLDVQD